MTPWLITAALSAVALADEPPAPPEVAATPSPADDALAAALLEHNRRRRRLQVGGMSALVTWSGGQMIAGAVGWGVARDPEWVSFHQVNLAWNAVNLGIGVAGLVSGLRDDPAACDLGCTLRGDARFAVTLGINAGLDVGYVATGAWLWERGVRLGDDRLVGAGRSLVLQGGFLLAFDTVLSVLHGVDRGRLWAAPAVGDRLGVVVGGRF